MKSKEVLYKEDQEKLLEHYKLLIAHKVSGVYLLSCSFNGELKYKIGSASIIKNRMQNIKTGNPYFTLIGFIHTEDFKNLEIELHTKFNKYRDRGEWFESTKRILQYFKTHKCFICF